MLYSFDDYLLRSHKEAFGNPAHNRTYTLRRLVMRIRQNGPQIFQFILRHRDILQQKNPGSYTVDSVIQTIGMHPPYDFVTDLSFSQKIQVPGLK
jgi:hypothetical protein